MRVSTIKPMCSKSSNRIMSGDAEVAVEVAVGVAAKVAKRAADLRSLPIVQLLL